MGGMVRDVPAPFAFVIDTEAYAGSFERELCAYATGIIGDCEVGHREAAQFKFALPGENPFEDIISQVPDDHGRHRPVTIWPTPGWFNNGIGYEFRENDPFAEKHAQENYERGCLAESKKKCYASKVHNLEHKKEWKAKSREKFEKFPAYRSVAIFFDESPSAELIHLMKKRATEYLAGKAIKLTGFRLLKLTSKKEEEIEISE